MFGEVAVEEPGGVVHSAMETNPEKSVRLSALLGLSRLHPYCKKRGGQYSILHERKFSARLIALIPPSPPRRVLCWSLMLDRDIISASCLIVSHDLKCL